MSTATTHVIKDKKEGQTGGITKKGKMLISDYEEHFY